MRKYYLSNVIVLAFMFMLNTTVIAGTTERFSGGDTDTVVGGGSIEVDLTNISSYEHVILTETEALEYFKDENDLNYFFILIPWGKM